VDVACQQERVPGRGAEEAPRLGNLAAHHWNTRSSPRWLLVQGESGHWREPLSPARLLGRRRERDSHPLVMGSWCFFGTPASFRFLSDSAVSPFALRSVSFLRQ
jgi:hypothetical protein